MPTVRRSADVVHSTAADWCSPSRHHALVNDGTSAALNPSLLLSASMLAYDSLPHTLRIAHMKQRMLT